MTQPVSNSLRSTPLGSIAAEWPLGAVGDFVAELKAGVSVNGVETEGGCAADEVGVLKSSAVLQGKFFPQQHKVVVPADRGRVATSVRADRIIISRMNTPALVGESGYVEEDAPHLFLPDRLWQTEPSNEPHSQRWLSYWMQHPALRTLIAAAATGTSNSMKNISKETVLSLPVPRTPLDEQTKIAAILEAVDDKLDVIARQIEVTQALKQGLMETLFSRGVGTQDASGNWKPHSTRKHSELGEIPTTWECLKLGEVLAGRPEYGANAPAIPFDPKSSIRYLRITDIDEHGRLRSDSAKGIPHSAGQGYLLADGDLLVARSGNTVGKSILYKSAMGPCAFAGYLLRLRFNHQALASFVAAYLTSNAYWAWVKAAVKVGAQPNINAQQYQSMLIPVPPIEEQNRIATVLASVNSKVELLQAREVQYRTLKRGLMQKLLTGEWRVKVNAEMAA